MTSHHHRNHRPLRLSLPPSTRLYPTSPPSPFPFSPSSLSTPSKLRRHTFSSSSSPSYFSLVSLLLSLHSLYSLLPFLRPSPPSSFSLFPFSFLVSLLSFSLYSLLNKPYPLPSIRPHHPSLAAKSSLLALSLLLRFHALRSCCAAATILAELSGSLLASSLPRLRHIPSPRRALGLLSLALALLALSNSWHRAGCSPLSPDDCASLLPVLLPFLSGFLSHHEKASSNWGSLRELGRRRARSLSLGFAAVMLFFPALISFLMADVGGQGRDGGSVVSAWSLGWPLFNAVLFGVLLNDNSGDEKVAFSAKDFGREFVVTFFSTLALEMFYFSKLSLPGLLFCGLFLSVSVRELGSSSSSPDYLQIGSSEPSESLYLIVMKPVRQILCERKSRKIAAFLLINTAYMVVEFVAGFMSNSLGLISDACHMLFDCAALAIGLYASYISRLPADHQYSYGRGRTEVLSGYVNAVFLVLVGALIVLESIERILDPQEISTSSLLTVSIGGLVVNVVGLIFFHEEHHHAHGGGGTCSHSHSPSNSHNHEHHHGHCSTDHDHGPNAEHHQCVEVSHEFSNDHSHAGHDHRHSCHNGHHHDMDNSNFGRKEDNHDHPCHGHGHDHHCHEQEHEHQDHHQEADVHVHQNPIKPEHDLQKLDTSSANSHTHCHNHCHCKETVNPNDMKDHSHVHSSQQKKPSAHKDSGKHHHIDHNMEGIFLHVLADTLGSVGVVISTLLIKYKGWLAADPACSIFISGMIVISVIPLLRNSAEILLQRVPRAHEQDLKVAVDELMRIKGVCCVQKLNTWNFTNTDIVGTLHLHVSAETDKASVKNRASGLLQEAGIKDITIQIECVKG